MHRPIREQARDTRHVRTFTAMRAMHKHAAGPTSAGAAAKHGIRQTQADEGVEVVEAVAEAHHGQTAFDDEPGSDRLGRHEAAHTVERHGEVRHRRERGASAHAPAEEPDGHVAGRRGAAS